MNDCNKHECIINRDILAIYLFSVNSCLCILLLGCYVYSAWTAPPEQENWSLFGKAGPHLFFFLLLFFFLEHKTASITYSPSVAITDNLLTLLRDDLWACTGTRLMIGWGHNCSVVGLPTTSREELMAPRLPSLTYWPLCKTWRVCVRVLWLLLFYIWYCDVTFMCWRTGTCCKTVLFNSFNEVTSVKLFLFPFLYDKMKWNEWMNK